MNESASRRTSQPQIWSNPSPAIWCCNCTCGACRHSLRGACRHYTSLSGRFADALLADAVYCLLTLYAPCRHYTRLSACRRYCLPTLYTVLVDTTQDSQRGFPTLHMILWLTLHTPCRRYTRRSARCCRCYTTLPTVFVGATEDPLSLLSCLALPKSVVYLCSAGSQVMLAHTTQ